MNYISLHLTKIIKCTFHKISLSVVECLNMVERGGGGEGEGGGGKDLVLNEENSMRSTTTKQQNFQYTWMNMTWPNYQSKKISYWRLCKWYFRLYDSQKSILKSLIHGSTTHSFLTQVEYHQKKKFKEINFYS